MAVPGEVKDLSAVKTEEVTFPVGSNDSLNGYMARPAAPGTYPGLIVIHEAFGMVDHIRDVVRRFANIGYVTVAPDLYSRIGGPDPTNIDSVFEKMLSLSDADNVRDLTATAEFLKSQEGFSGKLGCIGFCSGGRSTLVLACSTSLLDAAVDCWGGFITKASQTEETTERRPVKPVDMVKDLSCPLFAVFGREDQNPSPEMAAEMEAKAKAAGKQATIKVFENAGHAFLADYRPNSYREGAAFELWPQIVTFLDGNLK